MSERRPHNALTLLCVNQHTKFEVPSFTNSKDMIGAKLKKRVTWPWPRQLVELGPSFEG